MNNFDITHYQASINLFIRSNLSATDQFTVTPISVSPQLTMHVYKFGDPSREQLVICPPCGISFLSLFKLIDRLSKQFYVVTWESPGLPDVSIDIDPHTITLQQQTLLANHLLATAKLRHVHLIGWCQAAQVLLNLMAKFTTIDSASLTLIAPSGLGLSAIKSTFDEKIAPIYMQLAHKSHADVTFMRKMLFNDQDETLSFAERIRNLHLTDTEATIRYGLYLQEYTAKQPYMKQLMLNSTDHLANSLPIQLIHAQDDTFSHYSESIALAKLWPNSQLHVLPTGGHEIIFTQYAEIGQLLEHFIHQTE